MTTTTQPTLRETLIARYGTLGSIVKAVAAGELVVLKDDQGDIDPKFDKLVELERQRQRKCYPKLRVEEPKAEEPVKEPAKASAKPKDDDEDDEPLKGPAKLPVNPPPKVPPRR